MIVALPLILIAPVTQDRLSVDAALAIAEKNAFGVRIALATQEKTHQKANEVKGGLGPRVTLGVTDTQLGRANPGSQKATNAASATLTLPIDTSPVLPEAAPVSLSGVRALVVDDVDVNVRLLTEWLRSWGMRVDAAPDGERLGRPVERIAGVVQHHPE